MPELEVFVGVSTGLLDEDDRAHAALDAVESE
jgi:hypothetical protein